MSLVNELLSRLMAGDPGDLDGQRIVYKSARYGLKVGAITAAIGIAGAFLGAIFHAAPIVVGVTVGAVGYTWFLIGSFRLRRRLRSEQAADKESRSRST